MLDIIKNKMKNEIILVCEKCGKEKEIDEEQSDENWKIYKNYKKCKFCGGNFKYYVKK